MVFPPPEPCFQDNFLYKPVQNIASNLVWIQLADHRLKIEVHLWTLLKPRLILRVSLSLQTLLFIAHWRMSYGSVWPKCAKGAVRSIRNATLSRASCSCGSAWIGCSI